MATTAGMPRLRAMIAVCDMELPNWVTKAATFWLWITTVSAGVRSSATTTQPVRSWSRAAGASSCRFSSTFLITCETSLQRVRR